MLLAFNFWVLQLTRAPGSPFVIVISVAGMFAARILAGKEVLKELFHVETIISRTRRARRSFRRSLCCRCRQRRSGGACRRRCRACLLLGRFLRRCFGRLWLEPVEND
ncbi:hypothetical protein AGR4C_Lc120052 [Agrobacterium tumefaciens str. Kerr 14]|uniref:Uncharacterized protein n=1 Tax=Agrobacterium tumefaciens str. Kerr 14 TaxID=1183424 RepID=A0A1S7R6X1_AGRTU|nr:hypothetical protein AGR4C_Lc120052 [Agrobacterium tumefaciens str. Kerr 14]